MTNVCKVSDICKIWNIIITFVLEEYGMMERFLIYIILCWGLNFTLQAQIENFPLPEVPQVLVSPADRANYLAAHYWDKFDFKDNSLINKPEITEQGFANFISIMPYVTEQKEAFAVFAQRMTASPPMLAHLLEVSERYLFDNFSPVYDEELYLLLVDEVLKQPRLSLAQRERLRYQQRLARKNRVNQPATDFNFVLRSGQMMSLKEVKADYVLLFLNDPECSACREIKEAVVQSDILQRWKDSGRLKILSVCVEGKTAGWKNLSVPAGWIDGCDVDKRLTEEDLYDLRNLPAVYLLDADKRILLKNATIQRLEHFFQKINR